MKKLILILALSITPLFVTAQSYFDSLEDLDDVTSVIVNANMFNLMSNIDINTEDPEAKEYLELIRNITSLKVFVSNNKASATKMKKMMATYLKKSSLKELMRVKEGDANIKFYVKEGSNSTKVSELLMFVQNTDLTVNDSKIETVLLTLIGDFDLNQVSKLTSKMNIPGGKHLKNVKNK